MLEEEDDYLYFLSLDYKIIWNDFSVYFPLENGDASTIIENQRVAKIKIKKLSVQYKDALAVIIHDILQDITEAQIRKNIKMIEKGV